MTLMFDGFLYMLSNLELGFIFRKLFRHTWKSLSIYFVEIVLLNCFYWINLVDWWCCEMLNLCWCCWYCDLTFFKRLLMLLDDILGGYCFMLVLVSMLLIVDLVHQKSLLGIRHQVEWYPVIASRANTISLFIVPFLLLIYQVKLSFPSFL